MRRLAVCAVVLLLAGCGGGASSTPVQIYFMQGEQFHPVTRHVEGDVAHAAMEQLLAGPTHDEAAAGVETALPDGLVLDSVEVSGSTATVELSHAQTEPTPLDISLRPARAAQIVYTLTALSGIHDVAIHVNGEPRATFEGGELAIHDTIDRGDLSKPETPPSEPDESATGTAPADPATVQRRLVALRYLPDGAVSGAWDYRTQQAVLAFQGWEGIGRDGVVGPETLAALEKASAPNPAKSGSGHHVEVYLGKGVTLLVDGGTLVRALHSSSGAPGYETPVGAYSVFRKEERSWSVPYQVWLPWASYFNGGIALHESADVPPHPASHGCVRLPAPDAEYVYGFAPIGTPVEVLAG